MFSLCKLFMGLQNCQKLFYVLYFSWKALDLGSLLSGGNENTEGKSGWTEVAEKRCPVRVSGCIRVCEGRTERQTSNRGGHQVFFLLLFFFRLWPRCQHPRSKRDGSTSVTATSFSYCKTCHAERTGAKHAHGILQPWTSQPQRRKQSSIFRRVLKVLISRGPFQRSSHRLFVLPLLASHLPARLFSARWLIWLTARRRRKNIDVREASERSWTTGKYQEVWTEINTDKSGISAFTRQWFLGWPCTCAIWIKKIYIVDADSHVLQRAFAQCRCWKSRWIHPNNSQFRKKYSQFHSIFVFMFLFPTLNLQRKADKRHYFPQFKGLLLFSSCVKHRHWGGRKFSQRHEKPFWKKNTKKKPPHSLK